jgi:predicted nucleic acid-binding protein
LVVLDTSALVAFLDLGDRWNAEVTAALRPHAGSLVMPAAILAEISYFIERDLGQPALQVFVQDIVSGAYDLDCGQPDWPRVLQLIERYANLPLGIADAAVIACAERLNADIVTLDFRHFGTVAGEGSIRLLLLPS